jgi:hypothetical protein
VARHRGGTPCRGRGQEPGEARAEEAVDAHALEYFGRLSEAERPELHRLLARLIERPA